MAHATPDELLAALAGLGIATRTVDHPPAFTVADLAPLKATLPGGHVKNLFLKDRKGRLFLIVAEDSTGIDLKRLHETIGAAGRVSFGSADLLREVLGVEPGSVTPFAAVNDRDGRVTVVIDARLDAHDTLHVHPLVNTRTTSIARADLVAFLRSAGHEPISVALPAPPDCAGAAPLPSPTIEA